MGESFVDIIELDTLGREVALDRLQTGDVSNERRSRQAAEDEYRVLAEQPARREFFALIVIQLDFGQLRAGFQEAAV